MPPTQPPYLPEFRAESVRVVRTSDKTLKAIAGDLRGSSEFLRQWVGEDQIDADEREGLTSAEWEELRRLRRENRILLEEREILRKAAAFFARETDRTR